VQILCGEVELDLEGGFGAASAATLASREGRGGRAMFWAGAVCGEGGRGGGSGQGQRLQRVEVEGGWWRCHPATGFCDGLRGVSNQIGDGQIEWQGHPSCRGTGQEETLVEKNEEKREGLAEHSLLSKK